MKIVKMTKRVSSFILIFTMALGMLSFPTQAKAASSEDLKKNVEIRLKDMEYDYDGIQPNTPYNDYYTGCSSGRRIIVIAENKGSEAVRVDYTLRVPLKDTILDESEARTQIGPYEYSVDTAKIKILSGPDTGIFNTYGDSFIFLPPGGKQMLTHFTDGAAKSSDISVDYTVSKAEKKPKKIKDCVGSISSNELKVKLLPSSREITAPHYGLYKAKLYNKSSNGYTGRVYALYFEDKKIVGYRFLDVNIDAHSSQVIDINFDRCVRTGVNIAGKNIDKVQLLINGGYYDKYQLYEY